MDQDKLAQQIKLYLLDLDGTLYVGNRLFDFTLKLLDSLKANGRKYLFMTNNSSKSVDDFARKLVALGIPAIREDFITSSQATAYYLKEHYPKGTRIQLDSMGDDPRPIEPGTMGTVRLVDDMGTIHCDFDNGRRMGIIPGEDCFHIVRQQNHDLER